MDLLSRNNMLQTLPEASEVAKRASAAPAALTVVSVSQPSEGSATNRSLWFAVSTLTGVAGACGLVYALTVTDPVSRQLFLALSVIALAVYTAAAGVTPSARRSSFDQKPEEPPSAWVRA